MGKEKNVERGRRKGFKGKRSGVWAVELVVLVMGRRRGGKGKKKEDRGRGEEKERRKG